MLSRDRNRARLFCCAMLFACVSVAGFAENAPPVPVQIARVIPNARLSGEGVLTFLGFHIYDAQFWVGDAGYRPDAPGAAPFALEVVYARHFTGKAIAKTSLDEFERLDAGTEAQRQQWYEELVRILPDVESGQHLTGLFLPDGGLSLYSDGTLIGSIHDMEFARAFFRIWLDPRTKAPELREKLLANAAPRK